MKVLSIHINGFGKFRDYQLDFSEGLNVLYGLNEAGKSTIHAFIEGMFYGFLDPSKKTRRFFNDIDRYKPKDNASYAGSLIFSHEEKSYRIERNFQKRKGEVKLFNNKTGEDITQTVPHNKITKQIDFSKFLDMPYMLYKNTLSIKELEAKTESDASDALIGRLQNLKETSTESFSAKKAKDTLQKKLDDIGSEKAPTKPYAQALKKLDALKEEAYSANEVHKDNENLRAQIDELNAEKEEKQTHLNDLEQQIKAQENTIKKADYQKILNHLDQGKSLLESTTSHVTLTYRLLHKSVEDHNAIYNTLDSLKENMVRAQDKIETYEKEKPNKKNTLDESALKNIKQDQQELEYYQKQKKGEKFDALTQVLANRETNQNHLLSKQSVQRKVRVWVSLLFFLIVATGSTVSSIMYYPMGLVTISSVIIIPVIYGIFTLLIRKSQQQLNEIEQSIEKTNKELSRLEKAHDTAMASISKILVKYQVTTIDAFYEKRYRAEGLVENKQRLDRYETLINKEQETISLIESQSKPLLKRFELPFSIESFDVLKHLYDLHETIEDILGDQSFNAFEQSIDFNATEVDTKDYAENLESINAIKETLQILDNTIFKTRTELKQKGTLYRNISTIDYEIAQIRKTIADLKHRRNVLTKAIKQLEKATNIIEENFAPILSENIERYLPKLTSGNYSEIKVRKDLSFKAYASKTKTLEDATYFSTGTLDQIYFAVRIGILKTLKKDEYPFFLDDAFVNFDDERLKNVLKLLYELSKSHQILLFTCQKREQITLKTLNISYQDLLIN